MWAPNGKLLSLAQPPANLVQDVPVKEILPSELTLLNSTPAFLTTYGDSLSDVIPVESNLFAMVREESVGLIAPFTVTGETLSCFVVFLPEASVAVATTLPPDDGRLKV